MKNSSVNVRAADSNSTHKYPWKWYLSDLEKVQKNGLTVFSCFSMIVSSLSAGSFLLIAHTFRKSQRYLHASLRLIFTVKVLPSSGTLLTLISPPVRSITRLTSASPRPLPSVAWDVSP